MTRRGKKRGKRRSLKVVKGNRETLERELMWNIALDGDRARREKLRRMLLPAANDQLSIVPLAERPFPRGNDESDE
jgi:hypothetical protein